MPISAAPTLEDALPTRENGLADIRALPPYVLVGFATLSIAGLFTANPLLTAASILTLPILIMLSWRPGEPPALTFVLGFHWIQTTLKVFYADIMGVHVTEMVMFEQYRQYADPVTATWLSLAGTLVVAVGMRLAIRSLPAPDREKLMERAQSFSIRRTFWLFLGVSLTLTTIYGSVGYWSVFRQILLGAVQLKWVLYFLLIYLGVVRREGYVYLLSAFGVEFVSGIGFFSGFKEVFFVTIIAYFTARSQISLGTFLRGLVAVVALLFIGAAWTVVKPDFRGEISERNSQSAALTQEEQVLTLARLVSELDGEALLEGLEPLVDRMAYVDFFGYTLTYVPYITPHEGGALWGAAVKHILTPRILFPNKPEIAFDSEITNRYTGLGVAGVETGTSFSIGYMAESYVDFGMWGMFIPIFLSGLFRGLMFRYFVRREDIRLLGYGFAVALLINWYALEVATGKLLGGLLMSFIVLSLLCWLVAPLMSRWLRVDEGLEMDDEVNDGTFTAPIQQAWS